MSDTGHPEYPLTLWAAVSNSLAMTREGARRGLELERGRHPTLTQLRAAFGLDLDLVPAWDPLRSVRLPERTPSDAEIIEVMDGMYRGLASTRKVTVTATASGPPLGRAAVLARRQARQDHDSGIAQRA